MEIQLFFKKLSLAARGLSENNTNRGSLEEGNVLLEHDSDGMGKSQETSRAEDRAPYANTYRIHDLIRYMLYIALVAAYSYALVLFAPRHISDAECGRQLSVWSPLNSAIQYDVFDFDNEFDDKNEFRGPPTPELEEAWDKLWRFDPVPFPEEKLPMINRSSETLNGTVLARIGKGGLEGEIASNFEVFHQLHCLNYLRQYTWRDWYFRHPEKVEIPPDMLASDVGVRLHADHCIDELRTSLMCYGDTTPYLTYIDASQPLGARSDFSANHKCRNFEKLQSWTRANGKKFRPFKSTGARRSTGQQ